MRTVLWRGPRPAPGARQATLKETEFYGGTFRMPAKGDLRIEDQGLKTRAVELDLASKVTSRWSVGGGVRNDLRGDRSPIVPPTQEQGGRTEAVAQVTFEPVPPGAPMASSRTPSPGAAAREESGRIGAGGLAELGRALLSLWDEAVVVPYRADSKQLKLRARHIWPRCA